MDFPRFKQSLGKVGRVVTAVLYHKEKIFMLDHDLWDKKWFLYSLENSQPLFSSRLAKGNKIDR